METKNLVTIIALYANWLTLNHKSKEGFAFYDRTKAKEPSRSQKVSGYPLETQILNQAPLSSTTDGAEKSIAATFLPAGRVIEKM